MLRTISLGFFLFGFWLLLSGHYTPWLVGAGAVVSALLALAAYRFGFADEEGHPVDRLVAGFLYWPWLALEILRSSWDVARIVLHPKLPIAPRLFETDIGPRSAIGVATYANSITLTPGTITVGIDREQNRFLIHALTQSGEDGVRSGAMDSRVVRFEGRAP